VGIEIGSCLHLLRDPACTCCVTRRSAPVSIAAARLADAELGAVDAPDAPRAPPSA